MTTSDTTTTTHTPPIFPGYEAQPHENGVQHSIQKLKKAALDLSNCLHKLNLRVSKDAKKDDDDGDDYRMEITTNDLICIKPCETEEETLEYRCSCAFQMIPLIPTTTTTTDSRQPDNNKGTKRNDDNDDVVDVYPLQYAMRQSKKAIPLQSSSFGIATPRIQRAMISFLDLLNEQEEDNTATATTTASDPNAKEKGKRRIFRHTKLRKNLTSISFTSSWGNNNSNIHTATRSSNNCLLTLNYSQPLIQTTTKITLLDGTTLATTTASDQLKQENEWKHELEIIKTKCNVDTVTCRSKKQVVEVGVSPGIICDALYIHLFKENDEDVIPNIQVLLEQETPESQMATAETTATTRTRSAIQKSLKVQYQKPETAFQHPNGKTMLKALEWILSRCAFITSSSSSSPHQQQMTLLEMYSGCGAHTMAISQTGFFEEIVAVELDGRLVESCRVNCRLNGCLAQEKEEEEEVEEKDGEGRNSGEKVTPVHVFQGDAGEWARKSLHANYRRQQQQQQQQAQTHQQDQTCQIKPIKASSSSSWYNKNYKVLLVDPPRNGLDEKVCHMALHGTFTDMLYISCGRHALLKDLERLCCCCCGRENEGGYFQVVDCTLLDLFPRTGDSVETLVHLRRCA